MAKPTKKTQKKTEPVLGTAHEAIVRVTTKIEGFRRAGIAHYGTVEYPQGSLTEEQISQLLAEPNLVVDLILTPHKQKGSLCDDATVPAPAEEPVPENPEAGNKAATDSGNENADQTTGEDLS